jgi:hypothetical protein
MDWSGSVEMETTKEKRESQPNVYDSFIFYKIMVDLTNIQYIVLLVLCSEL